MQPSGHATALLIYICPECREYERIGDFHDVVEYQFPVHIQKSLGSKGVSGTKPSQKTST